MEGNQNTTINPVQAQPPMQAQVPQQTDVQPNMEPKSGSKHTLLLILMVVLALVLVLFIYVALLNKQENLPPVPTPTIPTSTPSQMTDEEQVNIIDVGDVDADLQEIETDLQNL